MSEIFFVAKSFFITGLIVLAMQVRVGSSTLEQSVHAGFSSSSFAMWVQSVAEGGALALRNGYVRAKGFVVEKTTGAQPVQRHEQRASF